MSSLIAPERSALTIRPHRSHRTLRVTPLAWLSSFLTVAFGLVIAYVLLRLLWPPGLSIVVGLVSRAELHVTSVRDTFLGLTETIPVPLLPPLMLQGTLWVAGGSVVFLVLSAVLPGGGTPLLYWLRANAVVLTLSALYAFFTGSLAYDGASFMLLVERTSILMVLAAPIFCGVVTALLPFTIAERVGMLLLTIVYDGVFALVRIAAFALLIGRFGAIAEANLYLFLGPLMDVVYFIAMYSVIVVSLSRRLAKDAEAWEWL